MVKCSVLFEVRIAFLYVYIHIGVYKIRLQGVNSNNDLIIVLYNNNINNNN
jgi:hypothetical protein